MATGKRCPDKKCNCWMYAYREVEEQQGSWVYYVCRKCQFEEKVFESK